MILHWIQLYSLPMANINLRFIVLCVTKSSKFIYNIYIYFFFLNWFYQNTDFLNYLRRNNWQTFEPYTNVLWLHYTLTKMITEVRYKRKNLKVHKQAINKLKELKDTILNYDSAYNFVSDSNSITQYI